MELVPQLWLEPLRPPGGEVACLSVQERRWGEALPAPRRQQYWASRIALRQRLAPLLGCPPAEVPLQAPPGQPPRLAAGRGWLGLSHSGAGLLIAYSPQPIGVDLERADRPLQARALAVRFFPACEGRQITSWPEGRLREAVLRSWVLKEAAIKWRCRSLALELSRWHFDHASGELRLPEEDLCPSWRAGLWGRWRWAAVGAGAERLELHPCLHGRLRV